MILQLHQTPRSGRRAWFQHHGQRRAPPQAPPLPASHLSWPCRQRALRERVTALRAAAKGLRGLSRPASWESRCGRETPSPDEAPSLSGFRGGCCVSPTGNKSPSWRGGAPVVLLLFFRGDRSRSTPWELGFPSAVNRGDQVLSGLPPRSGELNAWRGAGPATKGPVGAAPPPPPASLSAADRGDPPLQERARSHTHSHTHSSSHAPAWSLGCEEVSRARSEDWEAAVGSGAGSRAPALRGRCPRLSPSMGPGEH